MVKVVIDKIIYSFLYIPKNRRNLVAVSAKPFIWKFYEPSRRENIPAIGTYPTPC